MRSALKKRSLHLFTAAICAGLVFNLNIISAQAKTTTESSNNAVVSSSQLRHVMPVASGIKDVVADGEVMGWTAMLGSAEIYEQTASRFATSQAEEAVAVVSMTLPGDAAKKSSLSVSLWSPEINADSRLNAYRYMNGVWDKIPSSVRAQHIDLDFTGSSDAIILITKYPSFRYVHNPAENPNVLVDAIVNPDAVYGFSPSPDSTRLKDYINALDWTDPDEVNEQKKAREDYHKKNDEMYRLIEKLLGEGKDIETIARAVSKLRNEIRLASNKNDPKKLEIVKKSNLETYGNEEGPTADWLYNKYGSWQTVMEKALSTNAGMDACLGLYDDYYDLHMMNQ
jgi:hypothetical protein